MNLTCNSTLEEMRILPGDEIQIIGPLTFHQFARVFGSACAFIAVVLSVYLIFMHAVNYTKPREQRQIIRILLMVPVYAIASFCQIQWYWHAIYFQVMSDCYEAFAIASFFNLLCHYVAPDLHSQKNFFRDLQPIKPWVWPVTWFALACGGERGPWRTPKSGLTWFNIIWIGIYHYCFVRVAMTLTSVVTQYYGKYCESSNNPVFGHIWVLIVNSLAVSVAMGCVIQFYYQLRKPLAEYSPFLKVLAIKLVVFLAFWQTTCISFGTSTLNVLRPNKILAYPDIKVGIPALLLCFEMACFAVMHLWAFPYHPYRPDSKPTFYPVPDARKSKPYLENVHQPPSGGFLGLKAIGDALNLWDFIKAFGRGMRWLFCGVKRRKEDVSYKGNMEMNMDNLHGGKGIDRPPITTNFEQNAFGESRYPQSPEGEENDGLINNASPNPYDPTVGNSPTVGTSPPRPTQLSPYQSYRDRSPYPSEDGRDVEAQSRAPSPAGGDAYDRYSQGSSIYPPEESYRPQRQSHDPNDPSTHDNRRQWGQGGVGEAF